MKRWTVKQRRQHLKLTQAELAALSGVRQGVISRLESGKISDPGFALVIKLAKPLDVAPEQLRFGPDVQEVAR